MCSTGILHNSDDALAMRFTTPLLTTPTNSLTYIYTRIHLVGSNYQHHVVGRARLPCNWKRRGRRVAEVHSKKCTTTPRGTSTGNCCATPPGRLS